LNVGCIPSKALLESSENVERLEHKFAEHGIHAKGVEVDLGTMMGRKQKIIDQLTGGIAYLFKKNKITSIHGHGKLRERNGDFWQIEVSGDEPDLLEATYVIIATGSKARHLPGVPVDNVRVCDNVGALSLGEVPKRLGIIGAGVIGLEMGGVWKRLGSEVTILEGADSFLGAADEAVSREALRIFTKQGLSINTGLKIDVVDIAAKDITVKYATKEGEAKQLVCDKLIVAVGRVPNTDNLGADAVGLKIDGRGYVDVDDYCRTSLTNIFAIGDVVRGPMLAHKSSEEGVMVAEIIAGQSPHMNYNTIPWVIYTQPEIAWVGKTEQQLQKEGVEYRKGQFPFSANGRALGLGEATGFVKMLADARTDQILGVHIIGPFASELVMQAVLAMEFCASSEDIARIIHAHPSLSEVMHEAALAVDKRAIHN
jgi:dihydrolipoamide dehydrogenase